MRVPNRVWHPVSHAGLPCERYLFVGAENVDINPCLKVAAPGWSLLGVKTRIQRTCRRNRPNMGNLNDSAEIGIADSFVSFQNSQGLESNATLLRLSRFQAALEIYNPASFVRVSEALSDFKILMN